MEFRYITRYRGKAHVFTVDAVDEEDAWDAVMGCADPGAPGLLLSGAEWEQLESWILRNKQRG